MPQRQRQRYNPGASGLTLTAMLNNTAALSTLRAQPDPEAEISLLRSRQLVAKMSGKKVNAVADEIEPVVEPEMKVAASKNEEETPLPKDVRYWIGKVREEATKDEGKGAFVYLRPRSLQNPYNLFYCGYAEAEKFGRYFTLSVTGFTSYHKNFAEEFLSAKSWVKERELFNQARKFSIFGLFRAWKVLKIWRHNVIVETRKEVRHQLEKRLLVTRPGFVDVLLAHQAHCKHLEAQRLMDTSDPETTLTLTQFRAIQTERCDAVAGRILESARTTQRLFLVQVQRALDDVKRSIKLDQENDEAKEELIRQEEAGNPAAVVANSLLRRAHLANKRKENAEHPEEKEEDIGPATAFVALGFQQGLPYTNRSEIQKECKVFLKFAYLLDLLARTAVTNLYVNSMQTLEQYFRQKNCCVLPGELPMLKPASDFALEKAGRPILLVNVDLADDVPIPEQRLFTETVDSFEPPPLCHFDELTFDPTCHLEQVSETTQLVMRRKLKCNSVKNLWECWVKLQPTPAEVLDTLRECIDLMLSTISAYERHSDTPSLEPYERVVNEFEDPEFRAGRKGRHDLRLEIASVLGGRPEFLGRYRLLETFMESTRANIEGYLRLTEPYLLRHWKYQRIPWENIQSERLRHPVECLAVFAQQLRRFKDEFPLRIPVNADVGYVKLGMARMRDKLCRSPVHAIKRMDEIMVISLCISECSRRTCR